MIDQDRLAEIMDEVAAQHYDYIKEGQMAPRWWPWGENGELYREYNMKPSDGGEPYIGLSIPFSALDLKELTEGEAKDNVSRWFNGLGPMPSRAEWEAKN